MTRPREQSPAHERDLAPFAPHEAPCIERLLGAGVERAFLFGDERPFAQCHAATLVETRDGRFVVAFFAGTYEGHPDVAIWTVEGRAAQPGPLDFGSPRRAVKIREVAHWNPVLYRLDGERHRDPGGPAARGDDRGSERGGDELVLQFKLGERIRTWQTWVARSRDGGRSFGAAVPLVAGDRGGRGAVRNKPIRLTSGDWLAGASREGPRRWEAFFDRSPNGLDGWVATASVGVGRARFRGKGLIQPALWESVPGRIHALFRTTDGRIHRSDSQDDGRSWSIAKPLPVPNNNSALDVVRLADGTLALACNPVPGNWAARTPLSLLFSHDNGETWPDRIDVESGPGEFSYPALISSGAGLALCYTWNRRRIAFVRITSVRELLEARARLAASGRATPGGDPRIQDDRTTGRKTEGVPK